MYRSAIVTKHIYSQSRSSARSLTTAVLSNSRFPSARSARLSPPVLSGSPSRLRHMSSNTVVPPAADAPAVGAVAPDAPASNAAVPGTAVDQVTAKLNKAEIHQQKQAKVKKDKVPPAPAAKLEVSTSSVLIHFDRLGVPVSPFWRGVILCRTPGGKGF